MAQEMGDLRTEIDPCEDSYVNTKSREHWTHQIEFTLSCIGYTVSLGNFWRFSYLCMRNGGGAFLIPYFTFLVLCGIPLYFMEICIGQFSAKSPISAWQICPLFKGIGWGMSIVTAILAVYFNVIISWILYYLVMSLRPEVPWKSCGNSWNTAECYTSEVSNTSYVVNTSHLTTDGNHSQVHKSGKSAAEEFWSNNVLDLSDGLDNLGGIKWDLMLALIGAWMIVFLCAFKGIKSSGKVVYISTTLPYALLLVLLVRGVTLPGSLEGIKFYIIPDFNKLKQLEVWTEACFQVFFSLGPAWGSIITMASYNRFNNNCLRDAMIASVTCGASSLLAGFVVFSVVGYLSYQANLPVADVVQQGPGLAFVAYPEALSTLPVAPLWSFLFFLMLLALALDSQFCLVETVVSNIVDEFPSMFRKRKLYVTICVVLTMLISGLPLVTRGGVFIFQLFDWYTGTFSTMVIGFVECIVVTYVYGIGQFYEDISLMLKRRISYIWCILWAFATPIILFAMIIISAKTLQPPRYGNYEFPTWVVILGWHIAMVSILPIPTYAIYQLIKARGTFVQRIKFLLRPVDAWGPADPMCASTYKINIHRNNWYTRMKINNDKMKETVIDNQDINDKTTALLI